MRLSLSTIARLHMPDQYCGPCGQAHSGQVNDRCAVSLSVNRRSTRTTASKMSTKGRDVSLEVKEERQHEDEEDEMSEDEKQLRAELKDLRKKRRMEGLLAEKERLLHVDSRESSTGRRESDRCEAGAEESRGRRHSRGCRRSRRKHRSTSSESRSRTSSRERRTRSKWSLRKYTVDKKDLKKTNCYELIEASCKWLADQQNVSADEHMCFNKHLMYLATKAKSDKFIETSHVNYDIATRKLAQDIGFKAFRYGNNEASMEYYVVENFKSHTKNKSYAGTHSAKSAGYTKDGKKPCYRWNRESGCSRGEDVCLYGHWCSSCGSESHKHVKCTDKN